MSLDNEIVVAVSQFPLWQFTTNGSIQCFYNFVTSQYTSKRILWLILSNLDIDLNNPHKANANLVLNNKHQNVYVHNIQHPETEKIVFDFLKSQSNVTEIVTLDILPGMWGMKLKERLPNIRVWTHLCTLHYSKNVKVLIDESVISDTKSYDSFFINEIDIAKRATIYVTVSQSECAWIKTIVKGVNPMIYYPNRNWWTQSMFTCVNNCQPPHCIANIRDLNRDKLIILYIGRITHQKGIQHLLNVNLPANVHIVIMSSTSFGDEGLLQTVQKGLNDRPDLLTWIGPHYDQDKIKIIQHCDAVICPSIFEPFGLVGFETMLFTDTLLIASGVDGMQDYTIDGGFMNCGTSPKSIQETISTFAQMDVAIRRAIVEKGKLHALKCVDQWSRRELKVFPGSGSQSTFHLPSITLPLPPILKIDNNLPQ